MNKSAMLTLVKIAQQLDAVGEYDLANEVESVLVDIVRVAAKTLAKKKLDPKAKVRNRGKVVFPASSSKDKKDHFPINSKAQAQNALARASQYSKVPGWYSGSLESLVKAVRRAVRAAYPSIKLSPKSSNPGKG
jgi:hypothetical protein